MHKQVVYIIFIAFLSSYAYADSIPKVAYTPNFKFKEGLYLNFEQVKSNNPLPKSRILTQLDYNDPDFFTETLRVDKIFYYNTLGAKLELSTNKVWGYSRNGFIYINMNDGFYRITLIGSICHFVANHTTYSNSYSSAYSYGMFYDPYRYPTTVANTEMRQYILDFEHGRVMDYTAEALAVILMKDPELHDEYMALRKKKRKQLRFVYIRKFNEKHVLHFPKN